MATKYRVCTHAPSRGSSLDYTFCDHHCLDISTACRFACAFTLGSGLIMASFFALKGFRAQAAHMLDKDRLLFSMGAAHAPPVVTNDINMYATVKHLQPLPQTYRRTNDPRVPHALAPGSRAGYVGSMGATLYAALVMHSYIMSLICCAVQARLMVPVRSWTCSCSLLLTSLQWL